MNFVPVGLRHNRNWSKLWTGQAVSLVGDFVFDTTVVLWISTEIVDGRDWAPAAVGGLLIAAAVPVLLVGPIAGVYVDRWDSRRTMMAADLVRAGLIGLLLIVPFAGESWPLAQQLAVVYLLVALKTAASQFFNPARFITIAKTVAPDDQARAFGLASATVSTAAVVGPPLAAPLLFGSGVHWALLVNLGSYLVSFAAIWAIRMPPAAAQPAEKAGFRAEFAEGMRFFARNRVLLIIAAAVCVYMFGAGAINVLDVFFVTENLRVDPGWLGTLTAAFGIGSILGALAANRLAARFGAARVFALGIAATGLVVLLYARTTSLPVAIAVMALAGVPLAVVNVVVSPLVLRTTPQHLLGRVNAVLNPLVYLASIVSMAAAGLLAGTVLSDLHVVALGVTFGRIDAVLSIGALLMIAAGLAAYRPLTRDATAPPAAAPTRQPPAVTEVAR